MKQNYYFFDIEDIQPQITTIGFAVSEKTRNRFFNELLKLEERSPAESHLSLTLIKDGDQYRASLVVNSFSKIFRVKAAGRVLSEAFDSVIEKMDEKISSWKRNRNLGLSIKPLAATDAPLAG